MIRGIEPPWDFAVPGYRGMVCDDLISTTCRIRADAENEDEE